jgi:hypothetical protein
MRITDVIYTLNPPEIKNYSDNFQGLFIIILEITPEKLDIFIILFILFYAACTVQLALFILFYLTIYTA